jgi:hypothetical protein
VVGAEGSLLSRLSWLLIAYTIELDNEFEHRMAAVGRGGAFRASLVLWENFLQYVNPEGTRVSDLPALAGIAPQTAHLYLSMERHGYVTVEPDREHRPAGRPRPEWVVRRTLVGDRATTVSAPVSAGDPPRRLAGRQLIRVALLEGFCRPGFLDGGLKRGNECLTCFRCP